jgi:hypothetical protein
LELLSLGTVASGVGVLTVEMRTVVGDDVGVGHREEHGPDSGDDVAVGGCEAALEETDVAGAAADQASEPLLGEVQGLALGAEGSAVDRSVSAHDERQSRRQRTRFPPPFAADSGAKKFRTASAG